MTHEELLAKIDEEGEFLVQHFDSKPVVHSALRAVVELHKPEPMPLPDEAEDDVCSFCWHSGARWFYPCPTIEAIKKELG